MDNPKTKPERLDLLALALAGSDDGIMPTCLQAEGDGDLRCRSGPPVSRSLFTSLNWKMMSLNEGSE